MKVFKPSFSFRNWKIMAILFFPLQWFFFSFIGSYPHFIENRYSNGLFKYVSPFLRGLTAWIPFSVGESLLYIVIVFVVFRLAWGVFKLVKRQIKFKSFVLKSLLSLLAWTSVIYFLFMVLWGLNYHREPLVSFEDVRSKSQYLEGQDKFEEEFSTIELIGLCEKLIDEVNRSRKNMSFGLAYTQAKLKIRNSNLQNSMDDDEIIEQAYSGFHNINIENRILDYKIPSVKPILFTDVFSYLGVGGIYNPFTGEANVNMDPPGFLLPATVCHEMAHQGGIAPEDEANYVAYVVCRQHPDPFFQYSGYLMAMRYAMGSLKRDDRSAYDELRKEISEGVQSDLEENHKYWSRFKNPFEKYSDKVYDQYLKANKQQAGIKSYSRMVRLLLYDYRKKEGAME